jgi:hypothetical protein
MSFRRMKRLLLDLGVVVLFIAEYFCEEVFVRSDLFLRGYVIFNPLLTFVAVASLVGFTRGIAEERIFVPPRILWVGIIEWIFLVFAAYVLTCLLDVTRHPRDNFITVFGFNLFILLIPGLIISTGAYVIGRTVFNTFRKKT